MRWRPNWGLGFGLERLGMVVLRAPRVATVLVLASIIASIALVPYLKFDGDLTSALDSSSEAYINYTQRGELFSEGANAVAVIARSPDLFDPETFEGLRNLQLDLTLEDGVESVFSVFSLADAAGVLNDTVTALPLDFTQAGAATPKAAIERLIGEVPSARSLIAPDRDAMLLLVQLEGLETLPHRALVTRLAQFEQTVASFAPPGVTLSYAGRYNLRTSITNAIIHDQSWLTALGLALGAAVAWFLFGTWRAAVVCTLPPAIAVLWTLALFSATGTPLDFLSTALPTLVLIITFADTVVVYFKWQTLDAANPADRVANLSSAIREVGPASALTSITTALAFGSFALASSAAMDRFALFGVLCVGFAFIALMTVMPLATWWTLRVASARRTSGPPRIGTGLPRLAFAVTRRPAVTMGVALVLVAALGWVHFQLRPSYAVEAFLPEGSEIRAAESFVDEAFGGTAQTYAIVPVVGSDGPFTPENLERLKQVDAAVADQFGRARTISLASLDVTPNDLEEALDEAPEDLRNRFVARDGSALQVTASTSAKQNTLVAADDLADLKGRLAALPFGDEVQVTGLVTLLSIEFPKLIGELRQGLLASIFLVVAIVAIATRSVALPLAAVVPNLLPVLLSQALMWWLGVDLSITNVVALTIGFGIAIDNSVHVINAYRAVEGTMGPQGPAAVVAEVREAVREIAPALFAGTTIICIATGITLFSTMPSIAELGLLLVGTLAVALASNLAVLPSAMILMLLSVGHAGRKLRRRGA